VIVVLVDELILSAWGGPINVEQQTRHFHIVIYESYEFVYLAASRDRHLAIGFRSLGNRVCDAWLDAGWMLARCWLDAGLMLAGCWFDAGWILAGYWLDAGSMLAACRSYAGWMLARCWVAADLG
jgi:hypothetical protein